MTDPNGWPDADKPGVPMNPDKDGWHWLECALSQHRIVAEWRDGWYGLTALEPHGGLVLPHIVAHSAYGYTYIGPCLTPAEVAALVAAARREGMLAAAAYLDGRAKALRLRDAEDRGLPDHMGHSFEANAAEAWAAAIRAAAKEIKP